MTSHEVFLLFLALVLLDALWSYFLTFLNYRRASQGESLDPRLGLSPEDLARARSYSKARMSLGFWESICTTAVLILVASLGFFGAYDDLIRSLVPGDYWAAALYLGSLALASSLLSLPFALYGDFRLEKRFGFNTTTPALWVQDRLKGLVLGAALGLPLLALFSLFLKATGGLWWLWTAAAISLISLGLSVVYPLFIAPLFNKFSPLGAGELSDAIGDLARRLDFRFTGIYVMDGSKRSKHSNAYFTGLGASKRIVLYDTLISQLSQAEVLAVLAHEIGHEKRRHIVKMTLASVASSFVGFWVLSLLAAWPALYGAFGFSSTTLEALLLVFSLVSGPGTFFLTPLFSLWSRRHEYEADGFAAAAAGGEAMASALVKINKENASNPDPHPLYSFWYYSHPTLAERLRALGPARG